MPKTILKKESIKATIGPDYYVWLIAYIDSKFLQRVDEELRKYPEYEEVEAYIPTIKILKKTFKKENQFDDVPLLFNYGFFKIPRKLALYRDWLDNMKRNISCIYAWVRDPAAGIINGGVSVATASSKEVARLLKESVNMGAHTAEEIGLLKIGDPIVLRGYPFEGVNATVLSIDHKAKKVEVEIRIFDQFRPTTVSFDNVFFTIYHSNKNFEDSLSGDKSIDEMKDNKTFDKAQKKNWQE